MKIIKSECVVFFDVDDTLVMWPKHPNKKPKSTKYKKFIDPNDGEVVYLKPHERHIKYLRKLKRRGHTIMIWSGNGYAWAEAVIDTLGLDEFIDVVLSKPKIFVDDLEADKVLGKRVYVEEK